MNCDIEIKIPELGIDTIVHSDAELDSILLEHKDHLLSKFKAVGGVHETMYSIAAEQQSALNEVDTIRTIYNAIPNQLKRIPTRKWDEASSEFKTSYTGTDFAKKVQGAITVSEWTENFGNPNDYSRATVTPFNEAEWEKSEKEKIRADNPGIQADEIERKWHNIKLKNDISAAYGIDFHYIIQCLFDKKTIDPTKFVITRNQEETDKLTQVAQQLKTEIENQYPGAQFFTEFDICSKAMSPAMKEAINLHPQFAKVDKLIGRIDLLVVTTDGKVIPIDFKTSNKKVGDWSITDNKVRTQSGWWHSTKCRACANQVALYNLMLMQYGLTVEPGEIKPILLNFSITDTGSKIIPSLISVSLDRDVNTASGQNNRTAIQKQIQTGTYAFGITQPINVGQFTESDEIVQTLFSEAFIGYNATKVVKEEIDFYKKKPGFIKPVSSGDTKAPQSAKYFFWGTTENGKKSKIIYVKDLDADLDTQLQKYIENRKKNNENFMANFGKQMQQVLSKGHNRTAQQDAINMLCAEFDPVRSAFIQNVFRKYWNNGWYLIPNNDLIANGILVFQKGNHIEIKVISSLPLQNILEITAPDGTKAHTIYGSFLDDKQDLSDPLFTLQSSYGNITLVKIMALFAQNPQLLGSPDNKISHISVLNPWFSQENECQSLEQLTDNWNFIVQQNKAKHPTWKTIDPNRFFRDIDMYIHNAGELLTGTSVADAGDMCILDSRVGENKYNAEKILENMKYLRTHYQNEYTVPTTTVGEAYIQLGKALLCTVQMSTNVLVRLHYEMDKGEYVTDKVLPNGLMMMPASSSPSSNMRMLDVLYSAVQEDYNHAFEEITNKFKPLFDAAAKELKFNETVDNPSKVWAELLQHDRDGNLIPDLKLKRPSELSDKPACAELVEEMAEMFNKYRYMGQPTELVNRYRGTDDWYLLPLKEAGAREVWSHALKNPKELCKDIWNGMLNNIEEVEAWYHGEAQWQEAFEQKYLKNTGENRVYNKYLDTDVRGRQKLLEKTEVWETNIRDVFAFTMANACIADASTKWAPYFASFASSLHFLAESGGLDIPEIESTIQKWTTNKVFRKQIRAHSLDAIHSFLSVVKKGTSIAALGLSSANFTKEMITQMYISISRTLNKQIPGVSVDSFMKAFAYVIKEVPASLSKSNFVHFLNVRYRSSNMDGMEIAESLKRTKFGFKNLESGDLFVGTKVPDDYFRVALLIAHMMNDGCLEAYVEDKDNGGWKYDITKDKRFDVYVAHGLKSELSVDEKNAMSREELIKWTQQKTLFDSYVREWSTIYPENIEDIKKGKFLDAYPPSIKKSFITTAGTLYGFFNESDKSLLMSQLLGSLFMQYKTWLSAKLNQHLRAPGHANIWQHHPVRDERGVNMWMVMASTEELNNGKDPIFFVPEDDANFAKYIREDRAVQYIVESGTFQQGMVQATGEFLSDILHWDMKQFKSHWNNPILRGQLINGMLDSFGMMLLMGLINRLFGEEIVDHRREQEWYIQWTYRVLSGFANDGPLNKILGSMVTDLNPPSLIALKRWASDTNAVLAGSKSLGQALIQNSGALSDLQGMYYK